MRTAIIVQARMTSTRLPGKILKEVRNTPLLAYQIDRLKRVTEADLVVIATTSLPTDDVIAEFCKRRDIPCFRGSEDDVLSRYFGAASNFPCDIVVRITSDCPLIDPHVVDHVIRVYKTQTERWDYVSNTLQRSYPRGMDTEVFSWRLLEEAHREAKHPEEREHVTPFIYRRPDRYRIGQVLWKDDESHHRWTVDTPEDFELIRRILEAHFPTNPSFTLEDTLELLRRNPEWSKINEHIEQKKVSQSLQIEKA